MTKEEHIDMVLQHEIKKCSNLVGAEMLKSLNFDSMSLPARVRQPYGQNADLRKSDGRGRRRG